MRITRFVDIVVCLYYVFPFFVLIKPQIIVNMRVGTVQLFLPFTKVCKIIATLDYLMYLKKSISLLFGGGEWSVETV